MTMGTVFKRTATKPLPVGAEFFVRKGERFARWKTAKGKSRTAPVVVPTEGTFAGQERIVVETPTYTAKYRDGAGHVQTVATGCRDESAARALLGELEKRAELVKARVMTPEQDNVSNQQDVPFLEHVEVFLNRRTKRAPNGVSVMGRNNSLARLTRLDNECGFKRLSDLRAESLDRWMRDRLAEGMSPANINEFRQEAVIFANWCIRNKRLLVNPFKGVEKLDATANPRRKRRSMTESELVTLLRVARWRPLAEFGRLPIPVKKKEGESQTEAATKSKRTKWTYAPLMLNDLDAAIERGRERLKKSPQHIVKLDRLGRERALIFKTLVLTGLRKGELAAVTVGHFAHNGPMPVIVMNSDQTKNRQRAEIPLRTDLADDLRRWLATLQSERQGASDVSGERIALTFQRDAGDALPLDTPLFTVPKGLVRILNRDLATAGIPKRDERGRTIDVHALRHSFGTLLSKGGVAPRTAQAAMRHSDIHLTMMTYTDPKLLDVQGALDSLPLLPLTDAPHSQREIAKATGTDDLRASTVKSSVTPTVTPTADVSGHSGSFADLNSGNTDRRTTRKANDEIITIPSEKALPAGFASKASKVGMTGFEPATSTSRT
ncbi:MAG: site-specific integrase [Planctomycetaceae bacterium]|nr:site-specific integrase [Planctomycetaceae bacterium]